MTLVYGRLAQMGACLNTHNFISAKPHRNVFAFFFLRIRRMLKHPAEIGYSESTSRSDVFVDLNSSPLLVRLDSMGVYRWGTEDTRPFTFRLGRDNVRTVPPLRFIHEHARICITLLHLLHILHEYTICIVTILE